MAPLLPFTFPLISKHKSTFIPPLSPLNILIPDVSKEEKKRGKKPTTMTTQIKILLLLFLVLSIHLPSRRVECFKDGMKATHPIHEGIIKLMKTRKLMGVNLVMDYDDAGPNPKHDPRKGKPGGGGKIP